MWLEILEMQERTRWSTRSQIQTTGNSIKKLEKSTHIKKTTAPIKNTLRDVYVNKSLIVLNKSGSGAINELIIKSTSDFGVEVQIDGITQFHDNVSTLSEFGNDISELTATIHGNYYIFGLNGIQYYEQLFVRIYVTSKQKFDLIHYSVETP